MPTANADMTIDEYDALLKKHGYGWEQFEANQWGELTVDGIIFRMRVGLHMNKPMQVIMANNLFVRMREAPNHADYKLERLDPAVATSGLYNMVRMITGKLGDPTSGWKPTRMFNINWGLGQYLRPECFGVSTTDFTS